MDKRSFYQQQSEAFRDFASKSPEKDLLSLFNRWAFSKDFSEDDRHAIWKLVVKAKPLRKRNIRKGSEQMMRLSEVLEILLKADLQYLSKLIEKEKKKREKKRDKII